MICFICLRLLLIWEEARYYLLVVLVLDPFVEERVFIDWLFEAFNNWLPGLWQDPLLFLFVIVDPALNDCQTDWHD